MLRWARCWDLLRLLLNDEGKRYCSPPVRSTILAEKLEALTAEVPSLLGKVFPAMMDDTVGGKISHIHLHLHHGAGKSPSVGTFILAGSGLCP